MKKLFNVLLALVLGVSVVSVADVSVSAANLSKVKSLQSYNVDDDEINLKWKSVKGADGYQVKVYRDGKWRNSGVTRKPYFEVDDLRSAKKYRFKVRAYEFRGSKKVYGAYSKALSVATKADRDDSSNVQNTNKKNISVNKAQSVALNHAGLSKSKVRGLECDLDYERGVQVYEVSFESGLYDYEYVINAKTGKILHSEKDFD